MLNTYSQQLDPDDPDDDDIETFWISDWDDSP